MLKALEARMARFAELEQHVAASRSKLKREALAQLSAAVKPEEKKIDADIKPE